MIKQVSLYGAVWKISNKVERRILNKMSAGMRDHAMGDFIQGGDFRRGLLQRLSSYRHISYLYRIGFVIKRLVADDIILMRKLK
jgi:hypothetical protein